MSVHEISKRQIFLSFNMIDNLIALTPGNIWNEKKGGFVFWQQIVHALTGILYWLRTENTDFVEPFSELNIYPELEDDPENALTKEQVRELLHQAIAVSENFFRTIDESRLTEPCVLYGKITSLDVVFMQIRHLQYHIGHCEAILRDEGITELEWMDYMGD